MGTLTVPYSLNKYKRLWHNDVTETFDELKKEPEFEDADDNTLWNEAYDNINISLDCLKTELDIDLDNNILLIGKLESWDKVRSAYKETNSKNLKDAIDTVLYSFNGDNTFNLYIDDDSLYLSQRGHDNPVNPSIIEFRKFTDVSGIDDLDDDLTLTLMKHTAPIGLNITKTLQLIGD